jgi:hypothetical protein
VGGLVFNVQPKVKKRAESARQDRWNVGGEQTDVADWAMSGLKGPEVPTHVGALFKWTEKSGRFDLREKGR